MWVENFKEALLIKKTWRSRKIPSHIITSKSLSTSPQRGHCQIYIVRFTMSPQSEGLIRHITKGYNLLSNLFARTRTKTRCKYSLWVFASAECLRQFTSNSLVGRKSGEFSKRNGKFPVCYREEMLQYRVCIIAPSLQWRYRPRRGPIALNISTRRSDR